MSEMICAVMRSLYFCVRACAVSHILTGEDGAELGPAGDPSFRGVLAQCDLQEEYWQATPKQEDEVRDEKRTWVTETGNSSE